ncbi:MAG TPA: MarR family winged helix-turn-helix transcriptional regulator [Chitinophagaceae bacterium]|nr:MarR family winged helix-turn-helix transcriptional regulator [Chitinophagaceae bacterium]
MNKTVELVNEWASFEEKYPKDNIEDFCRYYLAAKNNKDLASQFLGGVVPPQNKSVLAKLLIKIVRMHNAYFSMSTKEIAIKQPEEFYFLSVIKQLQSPKKTEVIYYTVNELSNGLNILSSLIEQGYIKEQNDKEDKRTKRVSITAKGEKVLKLCYNKIHQVSGMLFMDMSAGDIELCIQLLKNIDLKFSGQWVQHKGKAFDDVYLSMTNK